MLASTAAPSSSNDGDRLISDEGASIQVFRLEAERPLNLIPNSKVAMPRRKESLGVLEAEVGSVVNTTAFNCTSGSLEQFELVCATPSCYLRLRQETGSQGLGEL
ncbi:uncharacterized protein STEHIDRAFT_111866 [Stereum hirsutum FP-91666 SS1]|uniref:uncharacterized protein n=1 Tax=Stereum hirsutum (strain FP-91666) TaxID=721885 RepID=UPI0004449EA8|nr:uncharacterized protein STEHIDRAFT_111866 [Stereum hirsutum FP-91666 SS1]EIM85254.1 hypothetical protein STEHIDRAFT_111866 [Stereum hirsutum FP-91666 SS1]